MYSVTIIGPGRVGSAFAHSLPPTKYRIEAVVGRPAAASGKTGVQSNAAVDQATLSDMSSIASDIVLIATQDSEIGTVVPRLAHLVSSGSHVFHTSGSLSSDILGPLRLVGSRVGSIHPLVSVSKGDVSGTTFRDAYFCVEGDPEAVLFANAIVADLGGFSFSINTSKKALYHASAVMACGHLVALVDAALEMIVECGINRSFAKEILMPLVASTVRNLAHQDAAAALTGPFARGDLGTVERHLAVLKTLPDHRQLQVYALLGDRSLDLALEKGADVGTVDRIRERICMANSEGK